MQRLLEMWSRCSTQNSGGRVQACTGIHKKGDLALMSSDHQTQVLLECSSGDCCILFIQKSSHIRSSFGSQQAWILLVKNPCPYPEWEFVDSYVCSCIRHNPKTSPALHFPIRRVISVAQFSIFALGIGWPCPGTDRTSPEMGKKNGESSEGI